MGTNPHVQDRLSDYLDGDLSAEHEARVSRHLAECADCARVLAELEEVVRGARDLRPLHPERDLWPGIAEGLEDPAMAPTESPDIVSLASRRRTCWVIIVSRAADATPRLPPTAISFETFRTWDADHDRHSA